MSIAPVLCGLLLAAAAAVVPLAAGPPPREAPAPHLAPAVGVPYRTPVAPARVVRAFVPPPTPYAAGHRGVDLAVSAGQQVVAAAGGTVTFAGAVAGRGVVVLAHADGIRTEYEPVLAAVRAGAVVAAGAPIGRVEGAHGGCAPGRCLHWGARRGTTYFDPMALLVPLGPVRLLPLRARADPVGGPAARGPQARGCACRYTRRSRSTETWV